MHNMAINYMDIYNIGDIPMFNSMGSKIAQENDNFSVAHIIFFFLKLISIVLYLNTYYNNKYNPYVVFMPILML